MIYPTKIIIDMPTSAPKVKAALESKLSYCGTCYGKGVTEKDVPVIDYVNGGYIETRYELCQECGGDG